MSIPTPASTGILIARLTDVVGRDGVLTAKGDLAVYECDGYTIEKNKPDVVVFPTTTDQIVRIVKICGELQVPFMARGAGTSLAGGCVPVGGGVMIGLARMKRILDVDYPNRAALVEPGVVNIWLSNRIRGDGYHYAPDPSSQGACTIGGNVATNSGGPAHPQVRRHRQPRHRAGTRAARAAPSSTAGGPVRRHAPGFDLTGVDRRLGRHLRHRDARSWVRVTRNPDGYRTLLGVFRHRGRRHQHHQRHHRGRDRAGAPWSFSTQLFIGSIEAGVQASASRSTPGPCSSWRWTAWRRGLEGEADRVEAIAKKNKAREVRKARTDGRAAGCCGSAASRHSAPSAGWLPQLLHSGRRRSPNQAAGDACGFHPRLWASGTASRIANVFHAGDGNIHPDSPVRRTRYGPGESGCLNASDEILDECIRLGGSVTGEHGIGVEKIDFMPKLFTPEDLETMKRLRDAFNPTNLCSPHKMLPTAGACAESGHASATKPSRRAAV